MNCKIFLVILKFSLVFIEYYERYRRLSDENNDFSKNHLLKDLYLIVFLYLCKKVHITLKNVGHSQWVTVSFTNFKVQKTHF